MPSKQRLRVRRPKFRTIWGELQYVCAKIHDVLYVSGKKTGAANAYLARLERILAGLPENDIAILREEGLALLHELKGDKIGAVKHRTREIRLMERLHEEVRTGNYDEKMRASILVNRDEHVLRERRAILENLKRAANRKSA